jgi:hypothetical protein
MDPENDAHAARGANPFSAAAIARVSDNDNEPYTFATDAVCDARAHVDAYLESDLGSTPAQGSVIAIIGEYGTGKTHLATALLRHARESAGADLLGMYVDAPSGTFLELYRGRFMAKLDRADVRARIKEYYADVVADSLGESELTVDIVRGLRERTIDPYDAVDRFGLMESLFQDRLRARLRDVTQTDDFGAVLSLALRPGFDLAVWDWLGGYEPDPILRDRGITTTINSDALALEAIGVFAILYGSQRHRFILVIDELEKILSPQRPADSAVDPFQKLLTVFAGSGGLLVLAGLPDFRDALSPAARQRISPIIRTSPLTEEQVQELIRGLEERVTGEHTLGPFTIEVVSYLVRLSGGVVRKIIRLCHYAYNQALEQDSDVTVRMVERAVRELYDPVGIDNVGAQIRHLVLDEVGLPLIRNALLGETESSRADYWIRVGDLGAGCALVLAESVLTAADIAGLAKRASAIREAAPLCEVLVLVEGFLAADLAGQLGEIFDSEPMVYDDSARFRADFALTIREMAKRLEAVGQVDAMKIIYDRVDLITNQQSATLGFLEQLAVHVDGLRTASDRQLSSITRMLQDVIPPPETDAGQADASRTSMRKLPDEVGRHFDRALTAVDDIRRVDMQLSEAFAMDKRTATGGPSPRVLLRNKLSSREVIEATGVAALLSRLIEAFRNGVWGWLDAVAGRQPDAHDEEWLHLLGDTFEAIYESLPTYRLDALIDLSGVSIGLEDDVTYSAKASRRTDVRNALDGLSGRVYRAALGAAVIGSG